MTFAKKYGPWAVVAGASEGIGRQIAWELAARGLPSVLVSRRQAPLDALAAEIRDEHGLECLPVAIDLSAADALERLTAAVGDREVGLWAGVAGADPNGAHFLDLDLAVWSAHVQRNVLGTMAQCHHFGGAMRERGRGALLLVGSAGCYGGASFMAAYSGSKAFELNFAESLWAELRPFGVDVLYLALGKTDTPAFRRLLASRDQPLPDDWAAPAEVARVGLERLSHGPVLNWGQHDDEAGFAPSSAGTRRARVLAIEAASHRVFGAREASR